MPELFEPPDAPAPFAFVEPLGTAAAQPARSSTKAKATAVRTACRTVIDRVPEWLVDWVIESPFGCA